MKHEGDLVEPRQHHSVPTSYVTACQAVVWRERGDSTCIANQEVDGG